MKKSLSSLLFILLGILILAGALMVLGVALAQTNGVETTATSTPTDLASRSNSEFCSTVASRIGGVAIPAGDVCDVVIVRQTPTIVGHDGRDLNKFTLMNSVAEFTRVGVTGGNVYVMGDFSLLETELNPVLRLIAEYGWTVTGVHNHMIEESPKLTFVHWEATGDPNTIIARMNSIFAATSIKGTGTGTTTPPMATTTHAVTPTGPITLSVIKHLCPSNIQNESDLTGQDKGAICPVLAPSVTSTTTGISSSSFIITAREDGQATSLLSEAPTIVTEAGVSHFSWASIPRGDVTITEMTSVGSRFGFAELDASDTSTLISSGNRVINLNTRGDADGMITIHIYNFR